MSLLLGYDLGSSSIKASLVDSESGEVVCSASSPSREMEIIAEQAGWAEQHPEAWWEHIKKTTIMLRENSGRDLNDISAIGISYQMHGLVIIDEARNVLRPSIIWCDSRAVAIGESAAQEIAE